MVEKARRAKVEEPCPDADVWEVFARDEADDPDDPPRYVGSIRGDDAEDAHAEASRLFCWFADEVWVCPAREVRKFSAEAAEDGEPVVPSSSDEGRTYEL